MAGDVESLAREIAVLTAEVTGCERVNIWLFNHDETELHCIELYEATPARHSQGMVLYEPDFHSEFQTLKEARYVDADDPMNDRVLPATSSAISSRIASRRCSTPSCACREESRAALPGARRSAAPLGTGRDRVCLSARRQDRPRPDDAGTAALGRTPAGQRGRARAGASDRARRQLGCRSRDQRDDALEGNVPHLRPRCDAASHRRPKS